MKAGAVLLCAGRGERLGRVEEKALVMLAGRPLFTWSLEALQSTPAIGGIVVVGGAKLEPALAGAGMRADRIVAWCSGGRERQHSVANGLRALPVEFDLVVVHDSARALVTPDLISRVVADAMEHGAAIAAVPVEDTLKRTSLGSIEQTVPRSGLWRAQTPQAFRRDWFEEAHSVAQGTATDDAALVEAIGRRVRITEGDRMNFKVTASRDLEMAEACLAARRARVS